MFQIRNQLKQNKIQTCSFQENTLTSKLPFSVIGATSCAKSNSERSLKGRLYPWGFVNIEDEVLQHIFLVKFHQIFQKICDFSLLRRLLFKTCQDELQHFKTNRIYEDFRSKKLSYLAAIDEVSLCYYLEACLETISSLFSRL